MKNKTQSKKNKKEKTSKINIVISVLPVWIKRKNYWIHYQTAILNIPDFRCLVHFQIEMTSGRD